MRREDVTMIVIYKTRDDECMADVYTQFDVDDGAWQLTPDQYRRIVDAVMDIIEEEKP